MAWGAVMRPMTLPDKAKRIRFLRPFGRPISTKSQNSEHLFRLSPLRATFVVYLPKK